MKKTIVALMAVIPLIFMFTVFSVGNATSINIDIAASGIVIQNKPENDILYVDVAEYDDNFKPEVDVLPYKAKNRNYTFKVSEVEGQTFCGAVITDDGFLRVPSVGKARITAVSSDGAFTDSFTVVASASKILDFDITLHDETDNAVQIEENADGTYYAEVKSGIYAAEFGFNPSGLSSDIVIAAAGQNAQGVVVDNGAKTLRFDFSGQYRITFTAENAADGKLVKTVNFNVVRAGGITVNGSAARQNFALAKNQTKFKIAAEFANPLSGLPVLKDCPYDYVVSKVSDTKFYIEIDLGGVIADEVDFEVAADNSSEGLKFTVQFGDFAFNVKSQSGATVKAQEYLRVGESASYYAVPSVYMDGVSFKWFVDNREVGDGDGYKAALSFDKAGVYKVSVQAYLDGELMNLFPTEFEITVVDGVSSLQFADKTDLGLAEQLAIGNKKYVGANKTDSKYQLTLEASVNGVKTNASADYLQFLSSDDEVAEISEENGKLVVNIKKTGKVALTAKWKYNDKFGTDIQSTINLYVVDGGVEVSSSEQFFRTTEEGVPVILKDDIKLGDDLTDSSGNISEERLLSKVKSTKTTYNWQQYQNTGKGQPDVQYIVEFKNSVYGNGFSVNAELFTANENLSTSTGANNSVFKGPLSFASIATASVAGQDNIVFLARTDNVVLYNVSLMGCGDAKLEADGQTDLTKLNYTGTVLDIGADVSVYNCRVKNGRTCIRVYGGNKKAGNPLITNVSAVNPDDERIEVVIDGCILSQAREFILKVNSNTALQGSVSDVAPALKNANGQPYKTLVNDYVNDDYFYGNYVLTDVALKDSVLENSGLFSIGMESNFAGAIMAQDENSQIKIPEWAGLNATSFPSILRLVGDVRIYDWKKLANVDSSTLIETTGDADPFLTLDIGAMLNEVRNGPDGAKYQNLLDFIDGEAYVHGGIAFYGGGKNYSQLDTSLFGNEMPSEYKVNINILANSDDPVLNQQGTLLPLAAGTEDFRFYMYDAASVNGYRQQVADKNNGTSYDGVKPVNM